jgi:hypothetical protein
VTRGPLVKRQWFGALNSDPILAHFFSSQDVRRALNGLKGQCRDLRVQPMPDRINRRSWYLTGMVTETSNRQAVTTVIDRWNGRIVPRMGFRG